MNPRPKSRPVTQQSPQLRPNASRGQKPGPQSDPGRPGCRGTPLPDLNYLNLGEIKAFCRAQGIPYSIWIETPGAERQKTREDDRKGVILERIRRFLQTGSVPAATCFPARVVCFEPPAKKLNATDRLYYPQYDPRRTALVELLDLDAEPALVIGLPVGFVGAAEAKDALRASGWPALTNQSDKGGAAVAAAALNALLYHEGAR